MESGVAVELEILAGVENVEAGNPEGDGGGEQEDARIEGTANRDPGRGRSDTQGETEDDVRPAREALGVGVEKENGERNRREIQREAIQLGGGNNKDGAGNDDERGDEGGRKIPGGKGAGAGAGIGGVDSGVGEAIECHGGGAGGNHGNDDPE